MLEKTVRELTGEILAEILQESWNAASNATPLVSLQMEARDRIVDIIMGVLARHSNVMIVNDSDLPVEPLPRQFPVDDEG
jgi:hypothetical protein